MSSRLHHLDSLRGLAAVAVAFHHAVHCFPDDAIPGNNNFIDAICGQSSVIFFFILSGFVLSNSLKKVSNFNRKAIISYSIKRFFRLYPTALASLIFSLIVTQYLIFHVDWSNSYWLKNTHDEIITSRNFTNYLREFILNNYLHNPPLWTIRVEFVCSLLLPFLILLFRIKYSLLIPTGIILAAYLNWGIGIPKFMFIFYLGYLINLLYTHIYNISAFNTKIIFFILFTVWLVVARFHFSFFGVSIILAGMMIVLVPCNWPLLKKFLLSLPLRFLGRISYSFYLLHFPMLYFTWSMIKYYNPHFLDYEPAIASILILFVISTIFTLPIATLSERFLEVPLNNIGHHLSRFK